MAKKLGATRTVNVKEEKLADVQKQLGMQEGFDVGCEMSGSPAAFRDMLANMAHGGKVALLGIPSEDIAIDWNTVVFNMLTIQGIYGREMYETWYKMTVMLQSGLDISPVITHRFGYRDFEEGFPNDDRGQQREGRAQLARVAVSARAGGTRMVTNRANPHEGESCFDFVLIRPIRGDSCSSGRNDRDL